MLPGTDAHDIHTHQPDCFRSPRHVLANVPAGWAIPNRLEVCEEHERDADSSVRTIGLARIPQKQRVHQSRMIGR